MSVSSVLRALPFAPLLACGGLLAESNADDAGPADAGFDDDAPYEPLPDSAMPPPALPGFVSAQGDSTCTLLNDGTVKCWGEVVNGALGAWSATPTLVGAPLTTKSIAVGTYAICAITGPLTIGGAGGLSCYGDDQYGSVGDGRSGSGVVSAAFTQILAAGVEEISLGDAFGCALTSPEPIVCWGRNDFGQVGPGAPLGGIATSPVPVTGLPSLGPLGTGTAHTCAVSQDRSNVYCWGSDEEGQLGDGAYGPGHDRSTPAPVVGLPPSYTDVFAGGASSFLYDVDDAIWYWGSNANGQLGTGVAGPPVTTPTRMVGLPQEPQLIFGELRGCAWDVHEDVYCWGLAMAPPNAPDAAPSYVPPTRVDGLPRVYDVAIGTNHVCASGSDSTVWCWGANDKGQCGPLAQGDFVATPVQVPF